MRRSIVLLLAILPATAPAQSTGQTLGFRPPAPLPPGIELDRTLVFANDTFHDIEPRLRLLRDLDGDGVAEFAVKARLGSDHTCNVIVFDGASLAQRFALQGQLDGQDRFGASLEGSDDLDQDGVADLLVGAPDAAAGPTNAAGVLFAFSGRTGALLFQLAGTTANQRFASEVIALPDWDGDGRPEFAVRDGPSASPDRLDVYDSTLAREATFTAPAGGRIRLTRAGDIDGDGIDDVVRASDDPVATRLTAVEVLDGTDGLVRTSFTVPVTSSLSSEIGVVADLDGDGLRDLAFGEPFRANRTGGVELCSSASGHLFAQRLGGALGHGYLGYSIAVVSDWDGDGVDDLAVGAPLTRLSSSYVPEGVVEVLSGVDLSLLAHLEGPESRDLVIGTFGSGVIARSTDGDGRPDLLVLAGDSQAILWRTPSYGVVQMAATVQRFTR